MLSDGDPVTVRRRRFAALAVARDVVSGAAGTPTPGRCHGVGFVELVEGLADPVGDSTRRAQEAVRRTARMRSVDIVAVYPRRGRRRLVELPRPFEASDAGGSAAERLQPEGARWVLAVAPEGYDRSDVAGSETGVILDPLPHWTRHPGFATGSLDARSIARAWEAFSSDGEALGLVLSAGDAFVSLGDAGRLDEESTLQGAAWQLVANR